MVQDIPERLTIMSIRERIVRNVLVTGYVYLIMIEARHGLVAGLIRPFVPWS